jgi:hypothetical protein
MDYSLISKVQKARMYAEEPGAFTFTAFSVQFHGSHREHQVCFEAGSFSCDCEYFQTHEYCVHTMAIERKLSAMMPIQMSGQDSSEPS